MAVYVPSIIVLVQYSQAVQLLGVMCGILALVYEEIDKTAALKVGKLIRMLCVSL